MKVQTSSGGAAALPLAANGASEYVIVHAAAASEAEIHAAEELRDYFEKITGARLPVVTDGTADSAREIVVGKTNREAPGDVDREALGPQGFSIRTAKGKLWLTGGGEAGTLYAVYTFLEDYLGCRFYTKDFEKIPHLDAVSLGIPEDIQKPGFDVRRVYYGIASDPVFSAKRKINNPSGFVSAGPAIHSLPLLAGTGDARRGPDPCLTSEETFEKVMDSLRRHIRETPGANYVSVSQCDSGESAYCHCPNCLARVKKYGWAGHYLLFVSRVAEALEKEFPGVKVHTFAYGSTATPDLHGVKAAPNVLVQLCAGNICFTHPVTKCTDAVLFNMKYNQSFADVLAGWHAACNYLMLWDYTVNFGGYAATWPNFGSLCGNYRTYAENGVKNILCQGAYGDSSAFGEFDYLRVYLLCRLTWDPYMTEEEYRGYMDEFLRDFYGPGWRHIRDFIEYAASVAGHTHMAMTPEDIFPSTIDHTGDAKESPRDLTVEQLCNFRETDWTPYYECLTVVKPNEILVNGYGYFDAALEEAETDRERFNIRRSALQLDLIKSFYLNRRTEAARLTLERVFTTAVDNYAACGKIGSHAEAEKLNEDFRTYIEAKLDEEYASFNRALMHRMLEYGVERFVEHVRPVTPENVDLWYFAHKPIDIRRGKSWYRETSGGEANLTLSQRK